jgi:DNA-binding SARP family transcriptional activator/Flp pilus assembly protein TadD
MLRVWVLGPVKAWLGDQELDPGPPRQRALLAVLASRASQVVPQSELIDALWGQAPPRSVVNNVHTYIKGLRRVLEPDRAHRAPGQLLLSVPAGYELRLAPGHLDANEFGQRLRSARDCRAAGDLATAVASLDSGLALWRASPLCGIPGPWADIERARLSELRLTAIEERAGVMLDLGRHAEALAELGPLVQEHPLRENFRAQLMVALYRCGRQAEALDVFTSTRRVLLDELGIEPGPELRALHRRILAADTALRSPVTGTGEVPVSPSATGTSRVPAQLPADVHAFIGRSDELASLDQLLAEYETRSGLGPSALVISAVSGTAGVGKTALAVRWAHSRREAFPDGQLYVNLRGYDPDEPVAAHDALAALLRALGVPAQDVPGGLDERATRFRALVDGRRMLILLDNAATAGQVRPLLPGSSSCLVIVTSRDSLAGLVARDGARRLELGLLPQPDAVALLRALIGPRVDADPRSAEALADQCARLPLALRVAAEMVAALPGTPLAGPVAELADERFRLDRFDADGDPQTAVRRVFSWSRRYLPADAVRAFRLIGLHPGPDLDCCAMAALAGIGRAQADALIALLAGAYLLQSASPGRHGMHDLLRAYAADLAATEDMPADRHAALARLFGYYVSTAAAAMDTLVPAERKRRPDVPATTMTMPAVDEPAKARAWLDAERTVLVASANRAISSGLPSYAIQLAAILYRYLDTGGHYGDAAAIHAHAHRAARLTGDRGGEAAALTGLGTVCWRQGDHQRAVTYHKQALALFRELGDRDGEARALTNISIVDWRQGRYRQAADRHQEAVILFRQTGDPLGEARALSNLGIVLQRQGHYRDAAQCHHRALELFRGLGDRLGEGYARGNSGVVCSLQGDHQQAARHLRQSLAIFRDLGDRGGQATALSDLGASLCRQGHYQAAASHQRQAVELFRDIGDKSSEAEALNTLGETLIAAGQHGQAYDHHSAALSLASQADDEYEQARAHNGIACTCHAAGDLDQARGHWHQALDRYSMLEVPNAELVRAHLAGLAPAVPSHSPQPATPPPPDSKRPG